MLLDAVLKSLSCATYVPTVTEALMLIDDGVITESFLKPNAKTAFFKAILKF